MAHLPCLRPFYSYKSAIVHLLFHVGTLDNPAFPLRPTHEYGLESDDATRHFEYARDGRGDIVEKRGVVGKILFYIFTPLNL